MNALINSQVGELERLRETYEAKHGKNSFPFSFEKYTGQESGQQKQRIIEGKPNIILTNFVMLELMLVRAREQQLRDSIFDCLRFLVFDELHTYRGRQGADVAMLIRRIHREARQPLACIGTSATMSSGGSPARQKEDVAAVASRIFGVAISPDQIVTESLRKVVENAGSDMALLQRSLLNPIAENGDEAYLLSHPLAAWIEQHIALKAVEGKWYRNEPKTLPEVIEALRIASDVPADVCGQRLKELLNLIQYVNVQLAESGVRTSYLQFRLHQFFLQTGSVYCTSRNPGNPGNQTRKGSVREQKRRIAPRCSRWLSAVSAGRRSTGYKSQGQINSCPGVMCMEAMPVKTRERRAISCSAGRTATISGTTIPHTCARSCHSTGSMCATAIVSGGRDSLLCHAGCMWTASARPVCFLPRGFFRAGS
jgi:hypothetical protein